MSEGIKVKQLIGSVIDMILFSFLIAVVIYSDIFIQASAKAITNNGIVEQIATKFNAVPILFFLSAVGFVVGIIACLDSLSIISLNKIKAMFESEEW